MSSCAQQPPDYQPHSGPVLTTAGISLIELIVVMTILAVLAAFALSMLVRVGDNAPQGVVGRTAYRLRHVFGLQQQLALTSEAATIASIRRSLVHAGALHINLDGVRTFPSSLDNANSGPASADNPLFSAHLDPPVTSRDWRKLSAFEYVGPTGNLYRYQPQTGQLLLVGGDPLASLGKKLWEHQLLVGFDSGALASPDLAFERLPNPTTGVLVTKLPSGVEIVLHTDGTAGVTNTSGVETSYRFPFNERYVLEDRVWDMIDDIHFKQQLTTIAYGQLREHTMEISSQRGGARASARDPLSQERRFLFSGQEIISTLFATLPLAVFARYEAVTPQLITRARHEESDGRQTLTERAEYRFKILQSAYGYVQPARHATKAHTISGENAGEWEWRHLHSPAERTDFWSASGTGKYDVMYDPMDGPSFRTQSNYEFVTAHERNYATGQELASIVYSRTGGNNHTVTYEFDTTTNTYVYTTTNHSTGRLRQFTRQL